MDQHQSPLFLRVVFGSGFLLVCGSSIPSDASPSSRTPAFIAFQDAKPLGAVVSLLGERRLFPSRCRICIFFEALSQPLRACRIEPPCRSALQKISFSHPFREGTWSLSSSFSLFADRRTFNYRLATPLPTLRLFLSQLETGFARPMNLTIATLVLCFEPSLLPSHQSPFTPLSLFN